MDLRKISFAGFILTAMVFMPVVTFAQEEEPAPEEIVAEELVPSATETRSPVTVTVRDRYTLESDVSRMSGQISVNQSDVGITYEHKAFDVLPVSFFFDYKHLDINENIPVNLPSRLEGRKFGVGTKFPMPFSSSEEYFMAVDVMPSWYTDDWTWTNSAFRVPFRLYGIYKPSETFVFIAGATIRPGYDTVLVPIIGFNWQPNERWDFRLASTEPTISYNMNENWALFAEYDGTLDEYEVTRAGQKGVVLKVREAQVGGGIKYHLAKQLEASVASGLSFARRFEYRDNVGKVDVDSAPYVKARLSMTF